MLKAKEIRSSPHSSNSDDLKSFIETSLKIAPVLLIVIGYFDLHSYYTEFDISIYNYIGSLEMLLRFAPFLYTFVILLFGAILVWLFQVFRWVIDEGLGLSQSAPARPTKKRLVFFVFSYSAALLLLLGFIFYLAIRFPINENLKNALLRIPEIAFSGYFILLAFYVVLTISLVAEGQESIKLRNWFIFVFLFSLALLFTISKNKISANNVLAGKPKYEVELISNDLVIRSDTVSLLFIGSVRDFTFLLDRRKEEVRIYRNSDFQLITQKVLRKEKL